MRHAQQVAELGEEEGVVRSFGGGGVLPADDEIVEGSRVHGARFAREVLRRQTRAMLFIADWGVGGGAGLKGGREEGWKGGRVEGTKGGKGDGGRSDH